MIRCLLVVVVAALACSASASAARARTPAAAPLGAWDLHEQRIAAQAGLLAPLDDGELHGERLLTAAQLRTALATLAARQAVAPVPVRTSTPPSVLEFDRLLVEQMGLIDVATVVQAQAAAAGLRPAARFGTEVVARLARLRHDQRYGTDGLELYPWQPITRAEAAWSLAQVAGWDGRQQQSVRDTLAGFVLPAYGERQLRVLRLAVAKVGMPYVWGGETDTASSYFGGQVHGGYDCSGFAWRVFKLSGDPAGRRIRGRVAADQAGEIARSGRLRLAQVRGGDLLFFGPGRFDQRATNARITHEGIALSPQFMIASSGSYGGVSVAPLVADDGRGRHFSWARRVLP